MNLIEKTAVLLGEPYAIRIIDNEQVIYRALNATYEFEVSLPPNKACVLYVWTQNPRELIGIYENIPVTSLKDVLGYFSVRYQNLNEQIRVLREDRKV